MEATRFYALFKTAVSYSSQRQIHRFRPFSSLPASATRRTRSFFSDGSEDPEDGSALYRHALKFQRPSIIKWRQQFCNSVSFIGTVYRPLKKINTGDGRFGVHTSLNVETSGDSNCSFKVLLKMWDEMAYISVTHMKPNDFIYVWGHLGSYTKPDKNGKSRINYEVIVKEINYVVKHGQNQTSHKSVQSESEGEAGLEKYKNRLHLWQVFFANPNEWWDNRKNKLNPKSPDFKHKDTGESLWLTRNDPPWIKKQLELHDYRLTKQGVECTSSRPNLSPLVYEGL